MTLKNIVDVSDFDELNEESWVKTLLPENEELKELKMYTGGILWK